jgi:hypothetical protein
MQLGDARKLDQRTQEALRQRAMLLVENGATHVEAALAVGVHRGTISRWYGAFRRNCRTVRTGETSFIVPIVGDEDVSNERSRTRRTAQAQGAATC